MPVFTAAYVCGFYARRQSQQQFAYAAFSSDTVQWPKLVPAVRNKAFPRRVPWRRRYRRLSCCCCGNRRFPWGTQRAGRIYIYIYFPWRHSIYAHALAGGDGVYLKAAALLAYSGSALTPKFFSHGRPCTCGSFPVCGASSQDKAECRAFLASPHSVTAGKGQPSQTICSKIGANHNTHTPLIFIHLS